MSQPIPDKMSEPSKAIDVYLLAASQEERMCQEIKKHLKPVIRNSKNPIKLHSDFDIPVGEDVSKYKERLFSSEIVLTFISVDFLDSDECHQRTQEVIRQYNDGQTILLPVLARNCLWRSTPFVDLPLVPENLQPLNNKQYWNSEDDALTEVANEIYEAIQSFSSNKNQNKSRPAQPGLDSVADIGPGIETFHNKPINDLVKPSTTIKTDWRKEYYRKAIWQRGKAFLLDNLLTLLPAIFIGAIIGDEIEFLISKNFTKIQSFGLVHHLIMYLIPLLIYVNVCAIFESSKKRGTFGKMIMKLQTTDISGDQITFFRAFWRNLLRLIIGNLWVFIVLDFMYFDESTNFVLPLLLSLIPLILQGIYFVKSKKLIHDLISKTVVGEKLSDN